MKLTPKEKRDIVVNYEVGYGKPNSPLWLMGFEEGGRGWEGTSDDRFREIKGFFEQGRFEKAETKDWGSSSTLRGYKSLVQIIRPDLLVDDDVFVTNLMPFAKATSKHNLKDSEKEMFGFHKDMSIFEIYDTIREERFKSLVKFFSKYHWEDRIILLCIGKDGFKFPLLEDFLKRLYKLQENEQIWDSRFTKDERIYLYHDVSFKRFITYHASRNNLQKYGILLKLKELIKF